MSKVIYQINDKVFEDFGCFVSKSNGLIDVPEPKQRLTFDWAEYHGTFFDLEAPIRYKERKISLDVFFVGDNWDMLKQNFNAITGELSKKGTQRLVVKPFNFNPLVFDVIQDGAITLDKTFDKGKMYGVAKINLIEPIPIKRTIHAGRIDLGVAYNSNQQTIININGGEFIYDGDVDIVFSLPSNENYINIYGDIGNLTTNGTVLL